MYTRHIDTSYSRDLECMKVRVFLCISYKVTFASDMRNIKCLRTQVDQFLFDQSIMCSFQNQILTWKLLKISFTIIIVLFSHVLCPYQFHLYVTLDFYYYSPLLTIKYMDSDHQESIFFIFQLFTYDYSLNYLILVAKLR